MRQPEEIRLGTPARDAVPAVVLYDDEEGLTVADGTPSPAAWHPEATEPVVAWQGTARDARVYAEMASLMVASGELLADEPEVAEPRRAATSMRTYRRSTSARSSARPGSRPGQSCPQRGPTR